MPPAETQAPAEISLVSPESLVDDDGTVVERYVYDPYGKVTIYNEGRTSTVSWANSKQNEILFCGYRFDPETGLYHVRHRMYHATLGFWLQRDPLGYVDGMSLYEYCRGQPSATVDPQGLGLREVFEHPGAAWEGFKEGFDDAVRNTSNTIGLGVPEYIDEQFLGGAGGGVPDLEEKYGTVGTITE